jgi:hypothetical protein
MKSDIKIQFLRVKFKNMMLEKVEKDQVAVAEAVVVSVVDSEEASEEIEEATEEVKIDLIEEEVVLEEIDVVVMTEIVLKEEEPMKVVMIDLKEDPGRITKRAAMKIDHPEDQDMKKEKKEPDL